MTLFPALASRRQSDKRLREMVAARESRRGLLIAFEGPDGSGKTTQRKLFKNWLKSEGHDVVTTKWNSSALIKETPAFGCPAVNIGSRQQGRLRGENVLDAGYDEAAIYAAIVRCITDAGFRQQCATGANPYGAGNAGPSIAEALATIPLDTRLLQKKMTY